MSNVRDDSNQTFLIRWRGKQDGPYTAAVIEGKLATNQISFLHEISHNGRWITLRTFLAERNAIAYEELQARNETSKAIKQDHQIHENEEHPSFDSQSRLGFDLSSQGNSAILKPHRGGKVFGLALGSWAIFFILEALGEALNLKYLGGWLVLPMDLSAWGRGKADVSDMDARIMDKGGRTLTLLGQWMGAFGAILKITLVGIDLGIDLYGWLNRWGIS